jgi:DNA polymerase-3 subunit delta'
MFENIIGQAEIVRTLTRELETGTFPNAVLFCGPACAGKLSAALETARILTCLSHGEWSCACAPCAQHRLLIHPFTILTGHRSTLNECRAARDVLERTRLPASRYLYLRAVRKLTRRFDSHIFHTEEGKRRAIQDTLLSLEDELGVFEPDRPLPEGKIGEKHFTAVEALLEKLETYLPRDNIPIAVIRNIAQWASFTAPSARKIVILESAARMVEASRNALLKTLEEPPADTHFILTAERTEDLIPTIRSRLRAYRFFPRGPAETKEVLSRVFREDNPEYTTLQSYFLAWEDINLEAIHAQARRFAEQALARTPLSVPDEFPELFRRDAPREVYRYFLEELTLVLSELLRPDTASPLRPSLERIESWARLVRARARDFTTLNLAPALFIESLYSALKEAS